MLLPRDSLDFNGLKEVQSFLYVSSRSDTVSFDCDQLGLGILTCYSQP